MEGDYRVIEQRAGWSLVTQIAVGVFIGTMAATLCLMALVAIVVRAESVAAEAAVLGMVRQSQEVMRSAVEASARAQQEAQEQAQAKQERAQRVQEQEAEARPRGGRREGPARRGLEQVLSTVGRLS